MHVSYMHSYLSLLERWLTEWTIAIIFSKSSTIIIARSGGRFIQPRSVTLFGGPINWVDTIRLLGVSLDKRLTWSPRIQQLSRITARRLGVLGPVLNRKSDLYIRNGVLLYKQLIRLSDGLRVHRLEVRCPHTRQQAAGVTIQVFSPCYGCPLVP